MKNAGLIITRVRKKASLMYIGHDSKTKIGKFWEIFEKVELVQSSRGGISPVRVPDENMLANFGNVVIMVEGCRIPDKKRQK